MTAAVWSITGTVPCRCDSSAAPPADQVLYHSSELVIYRTVDRRGAPVIVLTNLDDEGNVLAGSRDAGAVETAPAGSAASWIGEESCRRAAPSGQSAEDTTVPKQPDGGRVRVLVNRGDGEGPVDQGVEVATQESGGTTVIVNVNPPPASAPGPSSYYPVLGYGGLVGPYKYPDHLYFLGYGTDTSSPSLFGGLGLNAGNRFGLKTGVPCDRGYDCLFGPPHDRP